MDPKRNHSGSMWSVVYGLGMLGVFTGERLIGAGSGRSTSLVGVVGVLGAVAARLVRVSRATGDAKRIDRSLAMLYLLGLFSLVLYFAQSDLMSTVMGKSLDHEMPRVQVVLEVLWPALWLASALPIILGELAYASVVRAPKLEHGRVTDAILSGFGLAGALVFCFCIAYVSSERDKKIDLSYFRTARPGESTRKIVEQFDQPVQVSLFFPPANEVREQVAEYFDDLAKESKLLEVKSYDQAINPAKAKELGVSGNGIVVVSRGTRKEQMKVGLELEEARTQLRNLDKEVQKRLLQVARPARTVYLVGGHGERTPTPQGDTDKRLTIRELRELLTQQSYTVRDLGAAEGLAAEVPADAGIVVVVGPQKPFLQEELSSIERYLDRGGRLLVALDAENGADYKELLQPLGLKYTPVMLTNDQVYGKRYNQPSDRGNIVTGSYSSHPSVSTLGRLGMRAPLVMFGAGSLEELKGKDKPAGVTIDFPVHAHPATWNDLNGNFQFDAPAEVRKAWELTAAVVKKKADVKEAKDVTDAKDAKDAADAKDKKDPKDAKATKDAKDAKDKKADAKGEARVLVFADSDAMADGLLGNPGNSLLVLDGLRWLLGDESIAGEITSEADVPIAHTHKQDVLWFYATIFVAPALALGVGFLVNRRRRRMPLRSGVSKEAA